MTILKKVRSKKPVWERYPKYPSQVIEFGGENGHREVVFVVCRKHGDKYFERITLEVCMKSVFRFNPKSRQCRKCLGLSKGESFPVEFLEAKKEVHFPESLLVLKKTNSE